MEPEQYILDEWMAMCARAYKALQTDCPLIEDETLVTMYKYVLEQQERIAQLEQLVSDMEEMNQG